MADCSLLSKTIKEIAENIGSRPGFNTLDDILKEMKKDLPRVTRIGVENALVEATAGEKKEVDALTNKFNLILREARTSKATRAAISELNKHLEAKTFGTAAKKKVTATEAVKKYRKTRDQLKKELGKTIAAQKHRQKQQEPKNIKSLKDQIKVLEKHVKDGTLPRGAKEKGLKASDIVEGLRIRRNQLKKIVSQSEPAKIKRLEDSIAELDRRIKTGDVFPKPKVVIAESEKLEHLRYVKHERQQEVRAIINSAKPQTVWGHIQEPFNFARAMITSHDLSGVRRQGGFAFISHPIKSIKSIPEMLEAFKSKEAAFKSREEIKNRPNAPKYAKWGAFFAESGEGRTSKTTEEGFDSTMKKLIPTIMASERAYVTYLNRVRADSIDALVATLGKDGMVTDAEGKAIVKFVNIMTGRGDIGQKAHASEALSIAFFAPRYAASRFQLLLGVPMWGGTARTRKLIAKEYGRYLIGMSLVYALGAAAGGELEEDPRSSDFGKIKFGRTRLDPLSGISQTAVILSRIITGKTKSATGKVTSIRGDIPYGGYNTFDIGMRFLRGKFSPLVGTSWDIVTGENVIGEKVTPWTVPRNLLIPLALRDVYEVMLDQGIPAGTALSILAIFGEGLQTYGPKVRTRSENAIKPKKTAVRTIKVKKTPVRTFGRN